VILSRKPAPISFAVTWPNVNTFSLHSIGWFSHRCSGPRPRGPLPKKMPQAVHLKLHKPKP